MGEPLNNLEDLFCKQLGLYAELAELSTTQKQIIVDGDLEALSGIVERESALVLRGATLEEQRTRLMALLASQGVISRRDITLTELIREVEEPFATKFERFQAELNEVVMRVRRANQNNRILLSYSLAMIDRALARLAGTDDAAEVYDDSGAKSKRTRVGTVDKRA